MLAGSWRASPPSRRADARSAPAVWRAPRPRTGRGQRGGLHHIRLPRDPRARAADQGARRLPGAHREPAQRGRRAGHPDGVGDRLQIPVAEPGGEGRRLRERPDNRSRADRTRTRARARDWQRTGWRAGGVGRIAARFQRGGGGVAALLAWLATAGSGGWILIRWWRAGGRPARLRGRTDTAAPAAVILGHVGLGLFGLAVWVLFMTTGWAALAWISVGVLGPVAGLGMSVLISGMPSPRSPATPESAGAESAGAESAGPESAGAGSAGAVPAGECRRRQCRRCRPPGTRGGAWARRWPWPSRPLLRRHPPRHRRRRRRDPGATRSPPSPRMGCLSSPPCCWSCWRRSVLDYALPAGERPRCSPPSSHESAARRRYPADRAARADLSAMPEAPHAPPDAQ